MIPVIRNAMENKTQVIASLHPAYLARFGVTGINGIREAMKKRDLQMQQMQQKVQA